MSQPEDEGLAMARDYMVRTQIEARGVSDPRVLEAMRRVPRDRFVPEIYRLHAHEDHPLPLGLGQTISQPYIVAYMAEELGLAGHERVLEVGSGCGYMAAVLSLLAKDVYGIELEAELHERSEAVLQALGYDNIHLRRGNGREGWREMAPFDAILVSCAAESVPKALWEQLAEDGCRLVPLDTAFGYQQLVLLTKRPRGREVRELIAVSFVPLR